MLTDTAVLGPGGSERFLRNLASRLPERGFRVHLIQLSPEPPRSQQVAEPLQVPGLSLEHWPVGAIYGRAGWGAAWRVASRVRAGEFHLVQSQHEKSDFINALLPRGPLHTLRVSCRRDMGFQKTARVRSAFRRLNARFDHVLAPTPAILQGLAADENADAARMQCIPNGVDTLRFQPASAGARASARQALGYADGHFVVGCVASLSPVKRHADLLEAFARLHARLPQARLLLVGEGALRAPLQAQVASQGLAAEVQFTGARADMQQLLPAMDLFALASSSEGLSNAIIEAQAFGLPVVATAVGGNVDLVTPGRTGWTVPAHDPEALAEALVEAATHPAACAAAGRQAREQVLQRHSMEAMVAAYDAFYRRALSAVLVKGLTE